MSTSTKILVNSIPTLDGVQVGIPKEEKRKVMGRGGAGGRGEIPLKDLIEPPSLWTSSGAQERLTNRFYAPENPCTQPRTAENK